MKPFQYERADDVTEAIRTHGGHPSAMFLGGGTNLVDLMKLGVETPDVLVDVTRLASGDVESSADGGVRIGASVRNADLAADPTITARYPVLSQALLSGASPQLRNLATTAGNLLQRTRCVYFQDASKPCNKRDPGSGCPAQEGYHHNLAILGHSEACVATHPSDMAVALAALDAVVHVQGPAGERRIALTDFYRPPGSEPQHDTVLDPGELITAVELPSLPLAANSKFRKARDRASYAFALASVAAALDVSDGTVRDVRIALGGVAHGPWRAWRAERTLRGAPPIEDSFRRAADVELADARPLRDNGFKVPLTRNILVRTLAELTGTSAGERR